MKYLCIFLLTAIAFQTTLGQIKSTEASPLVDSDMLVWQCHAKAIGEDYTIYVNLPSGYDTAENGRPVLYLTDGDWNMNLARDCFSMLEQDYNINSPIIVGIGYGTRENKRSRDLEPKKGAPAFLSFIQNELMPFIKSTYHTNGNNALFGYSYGGLFAAYALFEHPGLFNTILIGAPGNDGAELPSLTSMAKRYAETHADLTCNVFAGVGSYEPEKSTNVQQFGDYLKTRHWKSLHYETVIVPGVAHGAGLGPVMQGALKFGYCHIHTAINLPATELQKYTGIYRSAEKPGLKLRVFLKNNNLYFQVGDIKTLHLVPCKEDEFFMYEDEKVDISFKTEERKQYFVFAALGGRPERIEKIN